MRFVALATKVVPVALGLLIVAVYFFDFGLPWQINDGAELEDIILHSKTPVLVDFYATWCGPCQRLAPILDEVAEKTPQVKFVRVDVDQHRDLAMQYHVQAIPCLILFKYGRAQDRRIGFVSKEGIDSMVRQ
ncbi:MAG: thioredoxin [Thermoguttaceae bacterium]